jgi:PKD repeat protein
MKTVLQPFKKLALFILFITGINSLNAQCSVSFSYTQNAGGNITFSATPSSSVGTYWWNFGDGTVLGFSGLNQVSHTYAANGTYTVSMTYSASPCFGTTTQTIVVSSSPCNLAMNASFTYTNAGSGLVNFSNTSSGTTTNTSYYWDFGDGTTSTAQNPSHTYTVNGNYSIYFSVNDPTFGTCGDSIYQSIWVSGVTCSVTAAFNYTQTAGGTVNFNSTSTGTYSGTQYTWYFGDGSWNMGNSSPSHTYPSNGTYTVSLMASNPGCSNTAVQTITVTSSPCSLSLNAGFSITYNASGNVSFVSTSTGTTASTNYSWNFGDGTSGTGMSTSHTYSANNWYNATLVLTDGACTDSITQTVNVTTAPCSIAAAFNYTTGFNGNVYFNNTSTGTSWNTTYAWSFGDGNTSGTQNPSHTYTATGSYTVTLIASSPTSSWSAGCSGTVTQVVTVSVTPCSISAGFTYTTGAAGAVTFSSTNTFTTFGADYYWDFGDGNTAWGTNLQQVSHTYSVNNIYNVNLFVSDTVMYTCWDTLTQPVAITNTACVANASFTLAKSSFTTTNLWYAYPSYPGNITAASWSWGDGNTSTGLWPSHTYASTGWYTICLSVTVSCGSSTTTCVFSNIYKMSAEAATAGMATINVMGGPTGIDQAVQENSSINLYPNPSNGIFSLEMGNINETGGTTLISIYNVLGESVYQTEVQNTSNTLSKDIQLENISEGTYFLKAVTKNRSYTAKIIITK